MPYKEIPRNRPIATLIKLYLDKKSGKVTDARKEIQKRFDYLDWKDQKRIVLAFLESGIGDREWAYGKTYRQWDDSYLAPIKSLWEKHHDHLCAWSVIQHFPIEYVKENAAKLEEVNGYYHLCLRLAEDPAYQIDKSKLHGKEYLLVMLNTHRDVKEEEAQDLFFNSLHDICLTEPCYLQLGNNESRGYALSVDNIVYLRSIKYIIQLLGLDNVVKTIEDWNQQVICAMWQGGELSNLRQEPISDDEYNEERIAIGLKYMYQFLDNKYKKLADEPSISKLNARVDRAGKMQFRHGTTMPKEDREPVENASKVLSEMIAHNPAIAKLVDSLSLTGRESEEDVLPF